MFTQARINAIRELADRGVGGEKANAQALLNKYEESSKQLTRPRLINYTMAVECAIQNRPELFHAYLPIAERIARDTIFTELGTLDTYPGQFGGIYFFGTETTMLDIQDKVNRNVKRVVETMEADYHSFCNSQLIRVRNPEW